MEQRVEMRVFQVGFLAAYEDFALSGMSGAIGFGFVVYINVPTTSVDPDECRCRIVALPFVIFIIVRTLSGCHYGFNGVFGASLCFLGTRGSLLMH